MKELMEHRAAKERCASRSIVLQGASYYKEHRAARSVVHQGASSLPAGHVKLQDRKLCPLPATLPGPGS